MAVDGKYTVEFRGFEVHQDASTYIVLKKIPGVEVWYKVTRNYPEIKEAWVKHFWPPYPNYKLYPVSLEYNGTFESSWAAENAPEFVAISDKKEHIEALDPRVPKPSQPSTPSEPSPQQQWLAYAFIAIVAVIVFVYLWTRKPEDLSE